MLGSYSTPEGYKWEKIINSMVQESKTCKEMAVIQTMTHIILQEKEKNKQKFLITNSKWIRSLFWQVNSL